MYVRELIQNAMDALIAREALGQPTPRTITLSPCGVTSPGSPADLFTITDHGIGVSHEQVEQVLATVGGSMKREDLERARRTYIGQFGIGLLSCFLITDEIVVVSRSATGDDPVEWTGRIEGTYRTRLLEPDVPVGTAVHLRPRPEAVGWVRPEQVLPLVQRYAEFLPVEIRVLTSDGVTTVTRPYPWIADFTAHRSQVRQGASPVYGGLGVGRQFDAIEVEEPSLGLRAVVYIGEPSGRSRTSDRNRLYVRDMLVTDRLGSLLPSWAGFAWAVAGSTTLEPTASRESVMEGVALDAARRRLGRAVLHWIRELADTDPGRFATFVDEHEIELRAAATRGSDAEKLELAAVVLPRLTVQTTAGHMRLGDIADRSRAIRYATSVDDFRTIASFSPTDRLVVNAGHVLDQEVLQTLPQVMAGVTVTPVIPASEIAALLAPAPDSSTGALELERRATLALTSQRCTVVVRHFPTADLPAVFLDHGRIDTSSPGYGELNHLVVNWDNRVVRGLARTSDDVVFTRVVQLLLVQTRMAAQVDGPSDRELLSTALHDVLLLAVGLEGRNPHDDVR